MPWADWPFEFVAFNDKEKSSLLIKKLKSGRELKCHIEYLHPLAGAGPKDEEEEGEEDE